MTGIRPENNTAPGRTWHYHKWCLALTFGYVATGIVASSLVQAPVYASPIFLPAGLAVGAAFIGGMRTLPWVFCGSLLLNLWLAANVPQPPNNMGFLATLLLALASTLQAGVGGWALRRVIGWPCAMDTTREVFAFPLLCLGICLTSVSLSTAVLVVLGGLGPDNVVMTWCTWWIGDTLGILVMLPLTLVFAGRPKALWRPRRLTVAVPILLCLLAVAGLYAHTAGLEREKSLGEFLRLSQQFADDLESRLDGRLALLENVAAFVVPDPDRDITREEFRAFVEQPLRRFQSLRAIACCRRRESAAKRRRTRYGDQRF